MRGCWRYRQHFLAAGEGSFASGGEHIDRARMGAETETVTEAVAKANNVGLSQASRQYRTDV